MMPMVDVMLITKLELAPAVPASRLLRTATAENDRLGRDVGELNRLRSAERFLEPP